MQIDGVVSQQERRREKMNPVSRRDYLKLLSASAAVAASGQSVFAASEVR